MTLAVALYTKEVLYTMTLKHVELEMTFYRADGRQGRLMGPDTREKSIYVNNGSWPESQGFQPQNRHFQHKAPVTMDPQL